MDLRTSYNPGTFGRHFDEKGREWREATPAELADAAPETLVLMRKSGGEPKPAGEYADLTFAGGYPFLAGMAALGTVYVLAEEKSG